MMEMWISLWDSFTGKKMGGRQLQLLEFAGSTEHLFGLVPEENRYVSEKQ